MLVIQRGHDLQLNPRSHPEPIAEQGKQMLRNAFRRRNREAGVDKFKRYLTKLVAMKMLPFFCAKYVTHSVLK